jgi:hypothetical protein
MKTMLITFSIALIPLISMAQIPDFHKNLMFFESYEGEDTLQFLMSAKTKEFKVMNGRFDVFKNGNTIILGAYENDLKTGKWLFFDDDSQLIDSIDYSIINNVPESEYDEVVDYNPEVGIVKEVKYEIGGFKKDRFPLVSTLSDSLGKVTVEFILNRDKELTNLKVIDYTHKELVSDVLFRFLNRNITKIYGINYNDKNVRVRLPIIVDIKKEVKLR